MAPQITHNKYKPAKPLPSLVVGTCSSAKVTAQTATWIYRYSQETFWEWVLRDNLPAAGPKAAAGFLFFYISGVTWFRRLVGTYGAYGSWSEATLKRIKKLNATDNTDALLAEAEFIFNNADLFVQDEELLAA